MAPVGQFSSQEPHSMQDSGYTTSETSETLKTVGSAGQTEAHVPQAIHVSLLTTGYIEYPPENILAFQLKIS